MKDNTVIAVIMTTVGISYLFSVIATGGVIPPVLSVGTIVFLAAMVIIAKNNR